MKRERALIAIIIVLALLASAMCGWAVMSNIQLKNVRAQLEELTRSDTVAENSFVPESVSALQKPDSAGIAAEFNGGSVTVEEAREEYGTIATYYYGAGMTEDEFAADLKMTVLQNLAEQKVLYAKAQELGLTQISAERMAEIEKSVSEEYESNIEYYSRFRFDEESSDAQIREETIAYLNECGLSYEDMLEEAKAGAWRDALYDYAVKDAVISDEQLKEYYDIQIVSDELTYSAAFSEYEADANAGRTMVWNPEGVRRIDTILIAFDPDQMIRYIDIQAELEAGNTDRMDELTELYAELEEKVRHTVERLAAGEDFAALQAEIGTWHPAGVTYVSAESTGCGDDFRDAAMALEKIGDVSEPVETDSGIAILRYAGDVQSGTVPFEQVKDALRSEYMDQYRQETYASAVEKWMNEANIRYYPENM